jgi:hypothetical protein
MAMTPSVIDHSRAQSTRVRATDVAPYASHGTTSSAGSIARATR